MRMRTRAFLNGRSASVAVTVTSAFFLLAGAPAAPAGETAPACPDFTEVVRRVAPAVVAVSIRPRAGTELARHERRWRDFLAERGVPNPTPEVQGSGVLVSTDGYIVTNEHVVRDAGSVEVLLHDGRRLAARLCGTDSRSDLAVLKVEGKDLPAARLAGASSVRVGQPVVALGSPYGLRGTVTAGIVSAKDRFLPPEYSLGRDDQALDRYYGGLLQTDAPTHRGNSGGPLVDSGGRVVGINVLIFSRSGRSEGLGFAIPAETVRQHLADLKAGRPVRYGYLGLAPVEISGGMAAALGLARPEGVLVNYLKPGGPAERAGVRAGDVLAAYAGERVRGSDDLILRVGRTRPGARVKLGLVRDGKTANLEIEVGQRPRPPRPATAEVSIEPAAPTRGWRGLEVGKLPLRLAEAAGVPEARGVLVTAVQPRSPAWRAGLRRHMILTGAIIAGVRSDLSSIEDFPKIAGKAEGPVLVRSITHGYLLVPVSPGMGAKPEPNAKRAEPADGK